MTLATRVKLYKELEAKRDRPLIVYITSSRANVNSAISGDVIPILLDQLDLLPKQTNGVDLFLASNGGDPTVSWRIVSLIRERVSKLCVLIPQSAFSAATLIALGADEIVMHPHGNLGPVDAQLEAPLPSDPSRRMRFGAEDLAAFLDFAKKRVGLSDQAQLLRVFELFCQSVGPVSIGTAWRSTQLSETLTEGLLLKHMSGDGETQKAKAIAESLGKKYFHHGYPLGRQEAQKMGLKIAQETPSDVLSLMWDIWLDIEQELDARVPFNPINVLRGNPGCAPLFDTNSPIVNLPLGLMAQLPQQTVAQLAQAIIGQIPNLVTPIPPAPFKVLSSIMESCRRASHVVLEGLVYGTRTPDTRILFSLVQTAEEWRTQTLPPIDGGKP